jgi:hypothetical protein
MQAEDTVDAVLAVRSRSNEANGSGLIKNSQLVGGLKRRKMRSPRAFINEIAGSRQAQREARRVATSS